MDQSFRGFLAHLEQRGDVQRVSRKVDPRFELASVLMQRDEGPVQIFENVSGYDMPVVAHVLNSRTRFAAAFGIPRAELDAHLQRALANPIPPTIVPGGPAQECRHDAP
ncbi:MAG: UbiD family decarboxylase, partial [Methylobacteriaceae bacterium]|nr:UbiD family decarboxylase [Methylobacteriaceae bacterium]